MYLAGKYSQNRRKHIRLTMQIKIINIIVNVLNKEILIPAHTRTRSKHGHTFHIMTKTQMNHIPVELCAKSIS